MMTGTQRPDDSMFPNANANRYRGTLVDLSDFVLSNDRSKVSNTELCDLATRVVKRQHG